MTPKEALKEIKENFIHNEYGESRGSNYDFGVNLCKNIEQALNELEELKRDVKRYFELDETDCDVPEVMEWRELKFKLMEVGKEE